MLFSIDDTSNEIMLIHTPKINIVPQNHCSYADFCSRLVLQLHAKTENIQNLPGIPISKLHRNSEGKFQWFFDSFLDSVIRPLWEAEFTPLIFKIFCKITTLMQTFACQITRSRYVSLWSSSGSLRGDLWGGEPLAS